MTDIIKEKKCKKCDQDKDLNCFYNHKGGKHGKSSICIDCEKTRKASHYKNGGKTTIQAYYKKNKDNLLKKQKAWAKKNREYLNNREKRLYKTDPLLKCKKKCRTIVRQGFKKHLLGKKPKVPSFLGCTWIELEKHFSSKFYKHPKTNQEMNFANHGSLGWHIDHIKPLDSALTEKEIIELCNFSNLQPMWAEENIKKSNYEKENIK
jgi:hypothetical protein